MIPRVLLLGLGTFDTSIHDRMVVTQPVMTWREGSCFNSILYHQYLTVCSRPQSQPAVVQRNACYENDVSEIVHIYII